MSSFTAEHKDGTIIYVRASTNGNSDQIMGTEERANGKTYLKIKTSSVAENGRANEAIIKLLAKTLSIPKSSIMVLSGHTSREKSILVNASKADIETVFAKL